MLQGSQGTASYLYSADAGSESIINSSCMCGSSSLSKTVGLLDHLCSPTPLTSARKQKPGANSVLPNGMKQVLGQALRAAYIPKGSTLPEQYSCYNFPTSMFRKWGIIARIIKIIGVCVVCLELGNKIMGQEKGIMC